MQRLATILSMAGALALLDGGDPGVAQRACSALESQLLQLQAGGLSRGEVGRAQMLRQRLARAGCAGGVPNLRSAREAPEPRGNRGISRRTAPRAHALRRPDAPPSGPVPSFGGTYRTMCVRHCDGYYFPMSFSTTRDRFGDDAAVCARMCPEAEVALYFHASGVEPADMVSIDGAAYSDLPAAFRYREHFDPGCSCGRPAPGEAQAAGREADESELPLQIAVLPRPRPSPAEDPETVANRQGGLAVVSIDPEGFASAQGRFGRPVRQVGPRYGLAPASELLVRPVSQ